MRFARTDLIARVEAAIARREQAATERNKKAAQKYEQNRQEYLARTDDAWKELATTIRRRTSKSQPMTTQDIPTVLRKGYIGQGHVATFDASEPDEYIADTAHLTTLLDLLKSATDDEITTTSLERSGFRMAQLFRAR